MRGWIKLHRKIIESPVFADPTVFRLWTICMIKATHKPREQLVGNQIVNLEPGQFVTGRNALTEEYNKDLKPRDKLKPLTLWRLLTLLETMGNLNIKSTNKFSVVTVVNYGIYQGDDSESDQQNEQQVNNKRSTNEQQMNTNKNVKNLENEKNSISGSNAHEKNPASVPDNAEDLRTGSETPFSLVLKTYLECANIDPLKGINPNDSVRIKQVLDKGIPVDYICKMIRYKGEQVDSISSFNFFYKPIIQGWERLQNEPEFDSFPVRNNHSNPNEPKGWEGIRAFLANSKEVE